jgi:hypothetical protein
VPDEEVHCRLRRALLTEEDLGGNWVASEFGPRSGLDHHYEASANDCGVWFPDVVGGLWASFDVGDPDVDIFISHRLYGLEPGAAERVMLALNRSCGIASEPGSDGVSNVNALKDPELGDESIAYTGMFDARWVITRVGSAISILTVHRDAPDGERLATLVAERMHRIGAVPGGQPVEGQGCPPVDDAGDRHDELQAALLVLEDLGQGWVEDPPEPCGLLGVTSDCDPGDLPEPEARLLQGFSSRRHGWLSQSIVRYQGDDADAAFERTRERLEGESRCTLTLGGDSLARTVVPVSGEPFGEDVLVWEVTVSGAAQDPVSWIVTLRRSGDTLLSVQSPGTDLRFSPILRPGDELDPFIIESIAPLLETAWRKLQTVSR